MEIFNFIGGDFVVPEAPVFLEKTSSFDGSVLARVHQSDAMDIIRAIQVAKKAFSSWAQTSLQERAHFLNLIADKLEESLDDFSYQEALYQGLSADFVKKNDVQVAIDIFRGVAANIKAPIDPSRFLAPTGLVAVITSWNLSLRLIAERVAPALAAGNVCLVKVSEHSPISGLILGQIFKQIQLPSGVVGIIHGGGEAAQVLASHPGVKAVTAVGKSATVEVLAKASVTSLKKIQLCGGAKNSLIVLADTDFQTKMPQILESFLVGQGQLCWNSTRLFVPESMVAEFMTAAQSYVGNLMPARSPRDHSLWTPLISSVAVHRVDQAVQSVRQEKGHIRTGGEVFNHPGSFYKPTVALDLPQCSVLQQDEISGPVLLVTPFKYQHEAVKWANTSYLGHSAVVWGPEEKALKVAQQLEVAQVSLNSWNLTKSGALLGVKQSGFGNPDNSWSGSFYSDIKVINF